MAKANPVTELVREIGEYGADPLGYTHFAFPWGVPGTALQNVGGPRKWQTAVLADIGEHLQNPETRFKPLLIAVASGHGIGKSALISMIAKWGLDTCVDTRIVVTANTENQLLTKTSPEVAKWARLAITRDWFKPSATKLASTELGHGDSWRLDFVTWSETNTEAFAGLHNLGKRLVIIFDEASNIADKVWEVTEGALTDEDTEIIWIAFGNPTRNTGRFRECFGRFRNRWKTRQIDSRTVEGTNKEYLQSIVDAYGITNDITKIRVLGRFPSSSSMQFIGEGPVEEARCRDPRASPILPSDPVIFGLDHARFGDDDSVLAIRQGRDARSREWVRWSGATSMEIAGDVNQLMRRYHPDAVFIDAGGQNAGGVIDRLRTLNPEYEGIFEISFGARTKNMTARGDGDERVRVANKRAQMWQNMKIWLRRALLPADDGQTDSVAQRLRDDLIGPEYSYDGDNAILLEKKEHMKARGLPSPDYGDALALTFAEDVAPRSVPGYLDPENYGITQDYDRYRELPGHEDTGGYDRYSELT